MAERRHAIVHDIYVNQRTQRGEAAYRRKGFHIGPKRAVVESERKVPTADPDQPVSVRGERIPSGIADGE